MKTLSNKEKRMFIKENNLNLNKKDNIIIKDNIFYINDKPILIKIDNIILPHLKNLEVNIKYYNKKISEVYIDKGAIPFILKGANLMRPGISKTEEFKKGEIVIIKDENYSKSLAIGKALFDSEEIKNLEKGKVIEILHYYNDNFFKF